MDIEALFDEQFSPGSVDEGYLDDRPLAGSLLHDEAVTTVPFPDVHATDPQPVPYITGAPIPRTAGTPMPKTRRPVEVPTQTFTVGALADAAGVTEQAVLKQIYAGAIPATRVGRRWIIPADAGNYYLQRHAQRRLTHTNPRGGAPIGIVPATAGTTRPHIETTPTPTATPTPAAQVRQLQEENAELKEQLRVAKAALAGMGTLLAAG
jgi:hypothetical protein